jgi:hypothetical protein
MRNLAKQLAPREELPRRAYLDAHAVRGRSPSRWVAPPGNVARRRVRAALRGNGFHVPKNWRHSFQRLRHRHVGARRLETSIRWRVAPGAPPCWGVARMARKETLSTTHSSGRTEVRRLWCWDLCRRTRRPSVGFRSRELHPDAWFLCLPSGGALVVPNCVFPLDWTRIRLPGSAGSWLWRYMERWDVLRTLPDLVTWAELVAETELS